MKWYLLITTDMAWLTLIILDSALHLFEIVVEGYFALGGMEMQFNVVDRETLLDAQIHPEAHENLIVRVSGYSAFFNDLSKMIQDEIIMRTEFA